MMPSLLHFVSWGFRRERLEITLQEMPPLEDSKIAYRFVWGFAVFFFPTERHVFAPHVSKSPRAADEAPIRAQVDCGEADPARV